MLCLISQHSTNLQDVTPQDFWLDIGVRPDGAQQFVMCDETTGVINQILQHGKWLRRQGETFFSTPQALIHVIKTEWLK